MLKVSSDKLAEVNTALAAICPPSQFSIEGEKVFLVSTFGDKIKKSVVRLRRNNVPYFQYGEHGMGGTQAMLMAHLYRWLADMPRYPGTHLVKTFERFGSPPDQSVILNSSYDDPLKTRCILCGAASPTDWWNLKRQQGPCCSFGLCLTIKPEPQNA